MKTFVSIQFINIHNINPYIQFKVRSSLSLDFEKNIIKILVLIYSRTYQFHSTHKSLVKISN